MKNKLLILCFFMALFVKAQTTTFIGADLTDSEDWSISANWDNGIPDATKDVIINGTCKIKSTGNFAKSVTLNSGAILQINTRKDLTVIGDVINNSGNLAGLRFSTGALGVSMGTLIIGGTYSGTEPVQIAQGLGDTNWHLISSPVSGETIDDFITAQITPNLSINGGGDKYAVGVYDDSNASGSKYTYYSNPLGASGSDVFGVGQGYAIKVDETGGKFPVKFRGTPNLADVNVTISDAGNGYNLIGNPYMTFLHANLNSDATNNLFTVNNAVLEEQTIWFYDGTGFTTINASSTLSSEIELPVTQGFFVQAKSGGGTSQTFSFTTAMQLHATHNGNFYKSASNRFEVDLFVTQNNETSKTSIRYIDGTTTSFDNGYDSSVFGGATGVITFSELVENNNGRKLAIQSLPNTNYEDMVIPIGVIATANSEIEFTTKALNVPNGYQVYLEDRNTNALVRLDLDNTNYKATVTEAETKGRFYLHARTSATLSADFSELSSVSIYTTSNNNLSVIGLKEGKVQFELFNILGKKVFNTSFTATTNNNISLPKISNGIYIANIKTKQGTLSKKIVLE